MMQKSAFIIMLGFSGVLAFYAAQHLPNHLETFESKNVGVTHPSSLSQEIAAGNEILIDGKATEKEKNPYETDEEIILEEEEEKPVKEEQEPANEKSDQALAAKLLEEGKNKEFLRLAQKYIPKKDLNSDEGKIWLNLLLEYAVKNKDYSQLIVIYRYDPSLFENDEEAALLLGKGLIDSARDPLYWSLRKTFEGRETRESSWLVLDADAYLYQGRREEAIKTLKLKEFAGKEDVPRLYRLALLHVGENPKKAFEWLSQAKNLDPENRDILLYRAKILEMAGKNDLAFKEYYSAWNLDPENDKATLELSDYYLRQKDFARAREILSTNFDKTENPSLLTKALFLGKVERPIKLAKKTDGEVLTPYVEYLANLRPWEFWNESYFDRIESAETLLESEQSAYWLRLLSTLKNDQKQEALDLLLENPFSNQSWNPELELALKEILVFQLYGSLSLNSKDIPLSKLETKARDQLLKGDQSTFLGRLNAYSVESEKDPYVHIRQEDKDLLSDNLAFAAALLETHWTDAALEMANAGDLNSPPQWLTLKLAKAHETNRNLAKALEFAGRQTESPELHLYMAELLIKEGKIEAAIKKLNEIKDPSDQIASQAAWLKALSLIEKGEYARARTEIQLNAQLDQSLQGKELLAKAALLEGKKDLAEEIYAEIGGESLEAKSFLARRHFEKGNYALAKKLTLELLEKNPGNEVLRRNMLLIEDEER